MNKKQKSLLLSALVLTSFFSFNSTDVTAHANVVVGDDARVGDSTFNPQDGKANGDAVVIGSDVSGYGISSVTIGTSWDIDDSHVNNPNTARTLTNGDFSVTVGSLSATIGHNNTTLGSQAVVGYNSWEDFNASGDTATGENTGNKNVQYAVALGAKSAANENYVVSVGNDDLKRRITNVATGIKGTDAVNVDQLNTATAALLSTGLNFKGTVGTGHSKLGDTISVVGGNNNITTTVSNNSITVNLSDDLTVNSIKAKTGEFDNLKIGGESYITPDGLNANNKTIINVADGVNPTDAVNKGQLDDRINSDGQTITILPKDTATTVDFRGTDDEGNRIDRVISGIKVDENDRSSATNVGYVNDAVSGLNNKLSRQIADVGANSAALAALHPVDYDPDYKFNIAAGYGNYKGENAYALGAFYRPNEDIMFSVGGTLGSDDNAINAGVSFKFGHSSKVVRQSDIKGFMKDVSERLARLEAENEQLKSENKSLRNVRASFPDVPKNHWANNAVEILHGNNVLEGYPDGEFKGDRPMTRYEYAQMLYKTANKISN